MIKKFSILVFLLLLISACENSKDSLAMDKLFTTMPSDVTGVDFQNRILESDQLHYYRYLYIYIGGGVAAADFNNDGLDDLFFTSNIYPNKLFLNKGDFKFEDITEEANIVKRSGFDAGVSVADVNNDGFVDIYINRAGWYEGEVKLANMLYINQGDLTFKEEAEKYGIADSNRSISSSFFDYDKDGDLDLFLTNAPADFNLSGAMLDLNRIQKQTAKLEKSKSSDKLYQNNGNGTFSDVSKAAGILPDVGFGLHAQVGDLNNDGWLDVYITNDFIMPDVAYVNNRDGTFTNKADALFKHISYYSMGADFADINNDGLPDLMVADMSPEDYVRSKTTMSMMSIDRFNAMTENGYHHQYMHNVLQLNKGKDAAFSEIANLSGVSKTDWSWATLMADFDLDGRNDLYVTNGVYRDVVDRDTNNKINKKIKAANGTLSESDFFEFTKQLPQQKLTNYLFQNNGDLTFSNRSTDWSDMKETFSNGAVYVDLDNDGDLDIVTNNLDENATILRNNSSELKKGNFLQITFEGTEKNPFGAGASVVLKTKDGDIQTRQLINGRGYLSSVSNKLHFGLGKNATVESLEVVWPDGKSQQLGNVNANQTLKLRYAESKLKTEVTATDSKLFVANSSIDTVHKEEVFNDFDTQLLLPHKLSQLGPAVAKSDLNNDGTEDLYLGGAKGNSGELWLSTKEGYKKQSIKSFDADKGHEDVSAVFFDADNDGDDDLYVVSGSYEFEADSPLLQDRLYLNLGNKKFEKSSRSLPRMTTAGATVIASDYDDDGDIDLFVGARVVPGRYPIAPKSTLLINESGKFKDRTKEFAEDLIHIGMVTTAQWVDIDGDDDTDLVVSGEWMGIEVLVNEAGSLKSSGIYEDLSNQKGWWNTIHIADVDDDGDMDIIAGNLGLNYKYHASESKPFHVYANDFDENGSEDIMLAKNHDDKLVPIRGKSCTAQQMPYLKERIKTYQEFAKTDLKGILGANFDNAMHLTVVEFRSGYYRNSQEGFVFIPFSHEAQISPINAILYEDFTNDGIPDLLLAGNNYMSEIETTRADAGQGIFLKGAQGGNFKYVENSKTNFYADADVRNLVLLQNGKTKSILVTNNNDKHQFYDYTKRL